MSHEHTHNSDGGECDCVCAAVIM